MKWRAAQVISGEELDGTPWISGTTDNVVEAEAYSYDGDLVEFWNADGTKVASYSHVFKIEVYSEQAVMVRSAGLTDEEIATRFTYHPPTGTQPDRFVVIRETAKEFAIMLRALTPESREQSLAFTALEEAVFWANAAIARREGHNTLDADGPSKDT